jgi:hypothetical protein
MPVGLGRAGSGEKRLFRTYVNDPNTTTDDRKQLRLPTPSRAVSETALWVSALANQPETRSQVAINHSSQGAEQDRKGALDGQSLVNSADAQILLGHLRRVYDRRIRINALRTSCRAIADQHHR